MLIHLGLFECVGLSAQWSPQCAEGSDIILDGTDGESELTERLDPDLSFCSTVTLRFSYSVPNHDPLRLSPDAGIVNIAFCRSNNGGIKSGICHRIRVPRAGGRKRL